ncbi:MAG: cysteine desulfurase NifS [Clostridiales bacterium]|nr:cysteine desulfurase NifS [Clostridiales bacterium]
MIYLDNSATTRPTDAVRAAVDLAMREGFFNPSALYAPAMAAEKEVRLCREAILKTLHFPGGKVVFTGCGTEADNLMISGTLASLREGTVLYTAGEHPAVKEPCLHAGSGITAKEISFDRDGRVDLEKLEGLLDSSVKLICVMQVNNETGAVQPLAQIADLRDRLCPGAFLHVDGVQGFLRVPFDMTKCRADSYALSGHKVHAVKGIGALVYGPRCRISPRLLGGGQESGMRSGTENTPGIAALKEAIASFPFEDVEKMRQCKIHLYHRIRELIPSAAVNGPDPEGDPSVSAPHVLNISIEPVRSETMLHALEGEGIYVGIGSACSSHKQKVSATLRAMGIAPKQAESALRFSLCPYNTMEEMDAVAEALKRHYDVLSRFSRR